MVNDSAILHAGPKDMVNDSAILHAGPKDMVNDSTMLHAGPKDMAAQHFATAGYFAPGRDISMADHMLDVVIRSEGAEVSELVDLYTDSQVAAADRALMHDLASSSNSVSK